MSAPPRVPPPRPESEDAGRQKPEPLRLPGLAELAPRYDGFILDLWGVIHNGVAPYPGVADCLSRLRAQRKHVVLLSNAPRRAAPIVRQMTEMGLARHLYDHVHSSGEHVHAELASRRDPWIARLGRACYHIGPERDHSVYEGLDLDLVGDVEAADFVLDTGPWRDDATVADYEDVLVRAGRRALPMICANPDHEVIRGEHRMICAGALAERYEQLGGSVRYYGKPYPEVYRRCFELLGTAERARILAVGDSLRTDIAGADGAGIDSVLVTGGLHAEEMGLEPGSLPDAATLAAACRRAGHTPVAVIPRLVW
jgi:HAD superfamily hydrolase (TIGR01459 family)